MKKVLLLVAVLAMVSMSGMAQFKYGGGLTLASDTDFGLNIRGDYSLDSSIEGLSISPGFTFFFPGNDITAWQLNADAHYKFYNIQDGIDVYGIGGLNYSYWKVDLPSYTDPYTGITIGGDVDDSKIGLDFGAGITYDKFFSEVKYDTAFEQVTLSVGILFGGE